MKYIKTIDKFVAGSLKQFEIHKCTVDEVVTYTSNNGREMIRVTVNKESFDGLYNKKVYDFLCHNEGSESFIVLWKSPKGKPMLAYVSKIWEDFAAGVEQKADVDTNNTEAFVYMWINLNGDMKYIGKHCGSYDDGYVASSETFMVEYNESPENFIRTILAYGSNQAMHELETVLLLQLKTRMSPLYYNLSDNIRGTTYE